MASPQFSPYHLFLSAFMILCLGFFLSSMDIASATSDDEKYLPIVETSESSVAAAGIMRGNSSSCTIPEFQPDKNVTSWVEGDKTTASSSDGCYKLKVVVAWAVGSCCMGLFVLGAWLMKRSIKNVAKVVAIENHNHDLN
ncbi:hypothetical protein SAY86_032031 [Trapa natans]|uniref:Transmembrane protein n=1 Tax=Trapa natans TaxID=22666 RepID=A0AAN7M4P8_TRANT|nr:hypothetical protein SAY86_032031 [Trapa natans]